MSATIVPDEDSLGHVEYGYTSISKRALADRADGWWDGHTAESNAKLDRQIRNYVVATLAGPIAEGFFVKRVPMLGTDEEQGLVAHGDFRQAVLLHQLLGFGSLEQEQESITDLMNQAADLVRTHWTQVKRVAAALVAHKELNHHQIQALCRRQTTSRVAP